MRSRFSFYLIAIGTVMFWGATFPLTKAALAYVDVTMKCVNCHKYVRQVRMARAPAPLAEQLAPKVAGSPARAVRPVAVGD